MRSSFTRKEMRAVLGLSAVLGARMLGFSLILPMFRNYAMGPLGATKAEAAIAFGLYGVSQAFLQIPFGTMSDRFGRKRVVAVGLLIFILGSVISALARDIWTLSLGYFLQGASAIGSAILAWVADSIDESRRNTGMALIGMSIGAAVVFGLPLSSALERHIGGAGIFWTCAALSTLALLVVLFFLHEPAVHRVSDSPCPNVTWSSLLADRELMVLNLAGFLVYFVMRAIFFVTPSTMDALHINRSRLYMIVGLIGAGLMGAGSRQSDKGRARLCIIFSFALTLIGYLLLGFVGDWGGTVYGYSLWFVGFCILQALLPGAVSKLAIPESRGATLGLFNTCQYVGAALGGPAGNMPIQALYGLMSGMTVAVIAGAATLRRVDTPRAVPQEA